MNLFIANTSQLSVNGKKVQVKQTTGYPFDGGIRLEINPRGKQTLDLKIRIPGWVNGEVLPSDLYTFDDEQKTGYTILLNGEKVESATIDKGYLTISRVWKKGDVVEVNLDMKPRLVKANGKVTADCGRIAVERGPLVYCAEAADNGFDVQSVLLPSRPVFQSINRLDLLGGIVQLKTKVQTLGYDRNGWLKTCDAELTLIPYYAWNHRGIGKMMVWLPQEISAVKPAENDIQNE